MNPSKTDRAKAAKRQPAKKPVARSVRGAALARHGDAKRVAVKVDAKQLARYRELMRLLESGERDEALGFDRYWEAVGEVIDRELFVAGGYATAAAWVAATVKEPLRTVTRMVRVARYASPEEEKRFHVAKLDAALSYIEAKMGGPAKGHLPVRFESLRIPVKREGGAHTVSLDNATVDEVRAATRAVLNAAKPDRAAKRSESEGVLEKLLAKEPALKGVSVTVHDGAVRFGALPLGSLAAFAKVLRAFRIPEAGENG